MIAINGMAHVVLTVSDFRRARAFYVWRDNLFEKRAH
jgi:catechol 2,3-dioxygenase-like lactoylglutathione lyase family enzyme